MTKTKRDSPAVHTAAEFRCPFCAGSFGVAISAGAIVHTHPPCGAFRRLDPLDFVVEARKAIEGGRTEEAS